MDPVRPPSLPAKPPGLAPRPAVGSVAQRAPTSVTPAGPAQGQHSAFPSASSPAAPAVPSQGTLGSANVLWLGRIPQGTDKSHIVRIFSQFPVVQVDLVAHEGKSAYAFLHFADASTAQRALAVLYGHELFPGRGPCALQPRQPRPPAQQAGQMTTLGALGARQLQPTPSGYAGAMMYQPSHGQQAQRVCPGSHSYRQSQPHVPGQFQQQSPIHHQAQTYHHPLSQHPIPSQQGSLVTATQAQSYGRPRHPQGKPLANPPPTASNFAGILPPRPVTPVEHRVASIDPRNHNYYHQIAATYAPAPASLANIQTPTRVQAAPATPHLPATSIGTGSVALPHVTPAAPHPQALHSSHRIASGARASRAPHPHQSRAASAADPRSSNATPGPYRSTIGENVVSRVHGSHPVAQKPSRSRHEVKDPVFGRSHGIRAPRRPQPIARPAATTPSGGTSSSLQTAHKVSDRKPANTLKAAAKSRNANKRKKRAENDAKSAVAVPPAASGNLTQAAAQEPTTRAGSVVVKSKAKPTPVTEPLVRKGSPARDVEGGRSLVVAPQPRDSNAHKGGSGHASASKQPEVPSSLQHDEPDHQSHDVLQMGQEVDVGEVRGTIPMSPVPHDAISGEKMDLKESDSSSSGEAAPEMPDDVAPAAKDAGTIPHHVEDRTDTDEQPGNVDHQPGPYGELSMVPEVEVQLAAAHFEAEVEVSTAGHQATEGAWDENWNSITEELDPRQPSAGIYAWGGYEETDFRLFGHAGLAGDTWELASPFPDSGGVEDNTEEIDWNSFMRWD